MAEDKGKKKKGGKLPIILVAVLVVAGGGFFAMSKGGGDEEKKEPKIELGLVESLGEEFLVNLGDGQTFLRCEVSVQLRMKDKDNPDDHVSAADPAPADDGHGKGGDHTYSIARDAVIKVLASKTLDDITKADALKYLKREIAAELNHVLHHEEPSDEDESDSKEKDEDEGEDSHGDDHGGHVKIDHDKLDELGWDSEKGPVLKVLITDFAFQKY